MVENSSENYSSQKGTLNSGDVDLLYVSSEQKEGIIRQKQKELESKLDIAWM